MYLIVVRILFISVYFCLFSYTHTYMASFWCWQASYTVSCQQGGGSTRPYFLWFHSSIFSVFYFSFHTLLFLSRERVVRNDSLIQRLGRQRSGVFTLRRARGPPGGSEVGSSHYRAASSAPPQRSVITPSGTLNYGSFGPQTLSLGPQDRFSLSL